ncbi:MAG: transporter substrate-binding domain-containing protein [Proteobacteria bacterium]|nr:transporter substrate-binding domain-containing protein [Pseudomonadota bacterium]MBU1056847.1 transporter substrate-binding domain-containing protein [Pseudomonadota bacterium]
MSPLLRPCLLLVTVSLLFLLSACTTTPEDHSRIVKIAADPSLLRIGVSTDSPPLIYKKNGKTIGLEADFGRRLGKFINKKVKFIETKVENQISALEHNEIDIIMSGLTITTDRKSRIAFTTPYLRSGQIMLVRLRDKALFSNGIYSLTNSNHIIGTVKGSTGALFISQAINGTKIQSFTQPADAVTALINKKIDAFFYDAPMICHYAAINKNKKLTPILTLSTEEYLAWGIRKEDSELQTQANLFLQELIDKEQLQRILRIWIPYL